MTTEPDPYRILGVDPSASLLDIARARRHLAKRYHPDLAAGEAAGAEMGRINAAWTLLSDAEARTSWDLAHGIRSATPGRQPVTWTAWAYPPPVPRQPEAIGSGGKAGWWVIGLMTLFFIAVVAAGILSTLDRPEGMRDPAPWLQENLDR